MKKPLLLWIIMLLSVSAFSQEYIPTQEDLNRFYNTKTYIVLDPNPISAYNFQMKDAVKNNWEMTDYEFITYDEFEGLRKNPDYSFLMEDIVVFERDKTKARYRFLSLMLGEKRSRLEEMPTLVSVPLSYREVDQEYWAYKLGVILRFFQKHILTMKENPDILDDNVLEYYNKNMSDIKDKTLFLIKDELAPEVDTRSEIKEYYPYEFKLVDREEVAQAIQDAREDVVFLHKVGPQGSRHRARCYKILMGAQNARFYYFDYHIVKKDRRPDGFLKRDFRKLKRKADGGLF
ncbi:MAG: hypothetical protein KGY60_02240 [Bacteroidales bacterium]|nr:hypothetical protein [Bacteroidales bacterium]